jgi:hypothetical protein
VGARLFDWGNVRFTERRYVVKYIALRGSLSRCGREPALVSSRLTTGLGVTMSIRCVFIGVEFPRWMTRASHNRSILEKRHFDWLIVMLCRRVMAVAFGGGESSLRFGGNGVDGARLGAAVSILRGFV